MAKYGQSIVEKICNLISSDDYTVEEICKQVGITRTTYFEWKSTKTDFSDALKQED